ncbi:hypothetical protein CR513_33216, partial [Mucuna pruriens]
MRLVVFFLNAPPSHDCTSSELRALSLASYACLFATGPVPLAAVSKSMVPTSAPSRSTEHYMEWVSLDVLKQVSSIIPSEVDTLVAKGTWVNPSSAHDLIMMAPFDNKRICHATQEDEDDFIFMYETIFEDLRISLPIDFFYTEISQGATWVSLATMHHMNLFRPYLESYKGFKTRYVKVLPMKDAPLTMDGEPIPWY